MFRSVVCACISVALLGSFPGSGWCHTAVGTRIDAAAHLLAASDPRIAKLDGAQQVRLTEFVVGNTLFVLTHELGHAVIGIFQLPVLGKEEDAADTFATLALLHVGTKYAHGVLTDAARGLVLLAKRDAELGEPLRFYEEHGLDQQRAYQIACLLFGSAPRRFGDLADQAKLPPERRETCVQDLAEAQDSWFRLLESHFRGNAPDNPTFMQRLLRISPEAQPSKIEIVYREAKPPMVVFRDVLMKVGVLEAVRDFAQDSFVLPQRLKIEAESCDEPNAYWDDRKSRLVLCYELVAGYAELGLRAHL
jgi:putative metallopeptidase DUF4344